MYIICIYIYIYVCISIYIRPWDLHNSENNSGVSRSRCVVNRKIC